jgi:hypothetical protein
MSATDNLSLICLNKCCVWKFLYGLVYRKYQLYYALAVFNVLVGVLLQSETYFFME